MATQQPDRGGANDQVEAVGGNAVAKSTAGDTGEPEADLMTITHIEKTLWLVASLCSPSAASSCCSRSYPRYSRRSFSASRPGRPMLGF
jgi:hypothetical protein